MPVYRGNYSFVQQSDQTRQTGRFEILEDCIQTFTYKELHRQIVTQNIFFNSHPMQYIIPKVEILRFNSFNITSKRGVYFTVHSPGSIRIVNKSYDGIISFMTVLKL